MQFLQMIQKQLVDIWAKMGWGQRISLIAVLAGLFITLLFIINPLGTSHYVPLFTRLNPQDAGEVVAVLREMGIPYNLEGDGSSIFVPGNQVHS